MTEVATDLVLYDVADKVVTITMNRTERNNAWNAALETAYFDALERARTDDDVNVIVVTGAGKMFSPGADMNVLQGEEDVAGGVQGPRRRQTFPLTIAKPIIGALHGACAGIGLCQALMMDIRFAAEGTKFTTAFARRGLIAEHGISWTLPRLVGQAAALDLLLSARVVLADEAQALGLVNKVFSADELLDQTLAYAGDVAANCSPKSMATMKAEVYRHFHLGIAEALDEDDKLMTRSFGFPDFAEGVKSFVERRPPSHEPLPHDFEPIPSDWPDVPLQT